MESRIEVFLTILDSSGSNLIASLLIERISAIDDIYATIIETIGEIIESPLTETSLIIGDGRNAERNTLKGSITPRLIIRGEDSEV